MSIFTDNKTETGEAKHRREFFLKMGNRNGTMESQDTNPCAPDPSWPQSTQARLQMSSFYHEVLVKKDDFW